MANLWGQRVTGLVPLDNSLIITTSSKGSQAWEPKFGFFSPEERAEYGAVYRAVLPGNLAVTTEWKAQPTTFTFRQEDNQLIIQQDERELGALAISDDQPRPWDRLVIRWGEGLFGPCSGKIIGRQSTVPLASLPAVPNYVRKLPPILVLGNGRARLDSKPEFQGQKFRQGEPSYANREAGKKVPQAGSLASMQGPFKLIANCVDTALMCQ